VKYNTENVRASRPKLITVDIVSNENNWIIYPMKVNIVF
jgi:hypothetical protein